jgi:hypothetical protein
LIIRYGLAGDAIINYDNIQSIVLATHFNSKASDCVVRLGLLKSLESYSVVIELRESIIVESFYGLAKKANVITLHIDDARSFVNSVNEKRSAF